MKNVRHKLWDRSEVSNQVSDHAWEKVWDQVWSKIWHKVKVQFLDQVVVQINGKR